MSAVTEFNPDLVRRHDGARPRYTSYPTAPHFIAGFGPADLLKSVRESNEDPIPRPLSLYAHIPFCHSPCFYCGCNRIISRDAARKQDYLDVLLREIALLAPLFDRDRGVVQLHLGGGTPNSLDSTQLSGLMGGFARAFRFAPERDRDFSIEVDPRTLQDGDAAALRAIGFNRISLGIQDLDADVQQAINRVQDTGRIQDILSECRRSGFSSVNFDLIYGLPKQDETRFARTLDSVCSMRPDRIALYGYAHMPSMFRAQNRINAQELPGPERKLALFQMAVERLMSRGYVYIGMDHFALPGDELAIALASGDLHRNFMGYTTRRQTDLLGFGTSAISQVAGCYAQNAKDIALWRGHIDAGEPATVRGLRLGRDDLIRADVIQAIMCQGEIRFRPFEDRYEIEFGRYFDAETQQLAALADDGLVELRADCLQVLPAGRLLLRTIASVFDAYLAQERGLHGPLRVVGR